MSILYSFSELSLSPPSRGCHRAAITRLPREPQGSFSVLRELVRYRAKCLFLRDKLANPELAGVEGLLGTASLCASPAGPTSGRYPSTSPQNAKSPPAGGLLRCVAGVAGFEPTNGGIKTRDSDQHNQQVTDPIHPAGPLDSLRFPIAATKAATSVRGSGRRAWPGSRRQELSPIRSTEAPRRTLSRHTNSAAGGSAYRPRRFDRVSESRTSSHQSRIDDDVGKVSLAPRNPTSCGMHQALSAPRVGKVGTRTRDPRRDRPVPTSARMTEEERAPHESGIYPILVGLRTYPLLPRH